MRKVTRIAAAVTTAAGAATGVLGALGAAPGTAGAAGTSSSTGASGAPGDDIVYYDCGTTAFPCPTGWVTGVEVDETTYQWKAFAINDGGSPPETGYLELASGSINVESPTGTVEPGGIIETPWASYWATSPPGCLDGTYADVAFKAVQGSTNFLTGFAPWEGYPPPTSPAGCVQIP